MKKVKTQSSQQTTLTSFFKTNPLKEKIDINVCSQASVDSGNLSDWTPEKSSGSSETFEENSKKTVPKNASKSKLTLKYSPRKVKCGQLIKNNNKKIKDSTCLGSPKKSSSLGIVTWLSPSKKATTSEENVNFNETGNKIPRTVTKTLSVIDLTRQSIEEGGNEIVLRRSPRKHHTSPPNLSKVKHKNILHELQPLPSTEKYALLDETDDVIFANFVSPIKINESEQKKRLRSLSQSPSCSQKKKRRSLSFSPVKTEAPITGCNEDINNFYEDVSYLPNDNEEDLSRGSRCRVCGVGSTDQGEILLTLHCLSASVTVSCVLLYPWSQLPVSVGDLVSVKATKDKDDTWRVSDGGSDWFVLHSDMLISCTTVVGSLFCKRRSVLSHIFKEISSDSQASAMYVGIIVHQLLQQALKMNLKKPDEIQKLYDEIINSQDFIKSVYLQGMNIGKIKETTSLYLPRICQFIEEYVSTGSNKRNDTSKVWPGSITEIRDIEENVWIPQYGLKGKIDATVKVNIHSQTRIMPLELKTGKPSNSVEHRGQVILYCMMLNQLGHDSVDSGLLLYLKDYVLKEVKGGNIERRDLLMLRNELASRIEQATLSAQLDGTLSLPHPIDRKSVCLSCPQLIPCTVALRTSGDVSHPLSALVPEITSHLSDSHLKYIHEWIRLVSLEIKQNQKLNPIWANSIHIREEEGSCLSDLKIVGNATTNQFKIETTFSRNKPLKEGVFSEGQYVIVSSDNQVALACGHVVSTSISHVKLLLDRDLSKFSPPFHIDRYEGAYSSNMLTSFLSVLLENSAKASSLRRLIIDKELPKFAGKLSSKIKVMCQEVFSDINRDQVRALLQVLSADSFILIKGMPGTGKSRTVGALIEVLTILGHSVLLTSHTHSAVDNILMRLPKRLCSKVLRLGSAKRVHPKVAHFTETHQLSQQPAMTSDLIAEFYNSKSIVGVTCLGAMHQLLSRREFDYCIVDEATQVSQPEALAALSASKKFVLIGDPNQLPPLVISEEAKELGMGISLLERLDRPAVTTSLTLQYRMNQVITSLANSFAYNNLLKCATDEIASSTIKPVNKLSENVGKWLKKVCSCKLTDSLIGVDIAVSDLPNHNVNEIEARLVEKAVHALKQVGIPGGDIGVISPYRAQVSFIEKLLKEDCQEIEVSTVDQYQGRDKSVILYSATRNKAMVAGSNDILGDKNRLTVAITRAKHKLVIIGNIEVLKSYPIFNFLFSFVNESNILKITPDEV